MHWRGWENQLSMWLLPVKLEEQQQWQYNKRIYSRLSENNIKKLIETYFIMMLVKKYI